jgi:hypothetical protein
MKVRYTWRDVSRGSTQSEVPQEALAQHDLTGQDEAGSYRTVTKYDFFDSYVPCSGELCAKSCDMCSRDFSRCLLATTRGEVIRTSSWPSRSGKLGCAVVYDVCTDLIIQAHYQAKLTSSSRRRFWLDVIVHYKYTLFSPVPRYPGLGRFVANLPVHLVYRQSIKHSFHIRIEMRLVRAPPLGRALSRPHGSEEF